MRVVLWLLGIELLVLYVPTLIWLWDRWTFSVWHNAHGLLIPPVVAYFVPRPLQFVAGIFPTYWPMRALWSAAAGESYAAHLVIGAVISALALLLAVSLFDRRLLRHG